MSSSLRRGVIAATTLALSAATLTACAAGNDAQTLETKPDNAATSVDGIKIQAVNVVTSEDGKGPAAITATLFNTGDKAETLKSIKIKGTKLQVKLSPAKDRKTLRLPAGGALALGGKGNASAVVLTGASAIKNGSAPPLVFDLTHTGKVEIRATVVPDDHDSYKRFGPSAKPSATADASPSTRPSRTPSGSATAPAGSEQAGPQNSGTPVPDAGTEQGQEQGQQQGQQSPPAAGAEQPADSAQGAQTGR